MSERHEIILSKTSNRVRTKIFELLVQQDADLTFNNSSGLYEVQLKVTCPSKEILDQVVKSMAQTEQQSRKHTKEESFSRVLDPLEIYEGDIKTADAPSINMEVLKEKIAENLDEAFAKLKKSILLRYEASKRKSSLVSQINPQRKSSSVSQTNPQQKAISKEKSTSREKFKDFLKEKLVQASQTTATEESPPIEKKILKSRPIPQLFPSTPPPKPNLSVTSSQEMPRYFRNVIRRSAY